MIRLVPLFVALVFVASGCAAATCGCLAPITVYGASSLAGALAQMKGPYMQTGRQLTISSGSSSALRTQIEQGAPGDVFLSADTSNPQTLVDAGLTDGQAVPFATNHLLIVVPSGNPAGITSPLDLARAGVRVIAAADDVPITKYALQAVAKLAMLPGYPPDFAAVYTANIVSREDNVGAVIAKIGLGEGDAAIVYVTDAKAAHVDTITIPPEANVLATYGGVVLRASTHLAAAHQFLDWVSGTVGQGILANLGFAPPP